MKSFGGSKAVGGVKGGSQSRLRKMGGASIATRGVAGKRLGAGQVTPNEGWGLGVGRPGGGLLESAVCRAVGCGPSGSLADCLRYVCCLQRTKKSLKSATVKTKARHTIGGLTISQPSPLGRVRPLDWPSPPMGEQNSRPLVRLSFMKLRGACPSRGHLRKLTEALQEKRAILGAGQIMCALESGSAAGMGDMSLWIPFLHSGDPLPYPDVSLQTPPVLSRGALGPHVALVQGYFEEYARIILVREISLQQGNDHKQELPPRLDPTHPTKVVESFFNKIIQEVNDKANVVDYDVSGGATTYGSDDDGVSSVPTDDLISAEEGNFQPDRPVTTKTIFPTEANEYMTFVPKKTHRIHPSALPEEVHTPGRHEPKTVITQVRPQHSRTRRQHKSNYKSNHYGTVAVLNSRKNSNAETNFDDREIVHNNVTKNIISEGQDVSEERISDQKEEKVVITRTTEASVQTSPAHQMHTNIKEVTRRSVEAPNISRSTATCQFVIGYKAIEGTADQKLMRSWLKWSGTWDAFTMMQEERLDVESVSMYSSRGRISRHAFYYVVIINVITPTTCEIQHLRSISQRLRVERWKGYSCVYTPVRFGEPSTQSVNHSSSESEVPLMGGTSKVQLNGNGQKTQQVKEFSRLLTIIRQDSCDCYLDDDCPAEGNSCPSSDDKR